MAMSEEFSGPLNFFLEMPEGEHICHVLKEVAPHIQLLSDHPIPQEGMVDNI
jgi:hypothetical protein